MGMTTATRREVRFPVEVYQNDGTTNVRADTPGDPLRHAAEYEHVLPRGWRGRIEAVLQQ